MIRTEQPGGPADATAPVRREWRAPELRELPADATANSFALGNDGTVSS